MTIRIGVHPLCWKNQQFNSHEDEYSIEDCVAESKIIGYQGIDWVDWMPKEASQLETLLTEGRLQLVNATYESHLLELPFRDECKRIENFITPLLSTSCRHITLIECSYSVHQDPNKRLKERPKLCRTKSLSLYKRLDRLATHLKRLGFSCSLLPYMGTVIQTENEIDMLLAETKELGLTYDTGQLIYAGVNHLTLLQRTIDRIKHIYINNVRYPVLAEHLRINSSYRQAILAGVFTVPGDLGIDFSPIFEYLVKENYSAWCVLKAEQDPEKAHPFTYAREGFASIRMALVNARIHNKEEVNRQIRSPTIHRHNYGRAKIAPYAYLASTLRCTCTT